MSFFQWRKSLLLAAFAAALTTESLAFHQPAHNHPQQPILLHDRQRQSAVTLAVSAIEEVTTSEPSSSDNQACYYRRIDGPWRPRKELHRISIGQRLFATRLPTCDLFFGKTGPKAFLECGIGRINTKGEWSIVNGMLRIGRKGMKPSVVRKKIKKNMPSDELFEVYVSKIRVEEGTFEVCLTKDEAIERASQRRIPASSLKEGEELTGTVRDIKPYGIFVDVNANRNGLLHISKVARRQDKYVNKEEGLKKLGLGRGSSVDVIVVSNDKKRLELDLAPVREETDLVVDEEVVGSDDAIGAMMSEEEAAAWAAYGAGEEKEESNDGNGVVGDEAAMWAAYAADDDSSSNTNSAENAGSNDMSDDEAAMWAAYGAAESSNNEDDEDDFDEDADIEDSLGIGSY